MQLSSQMRTIFKYSDNLATPNPADSETRPKPRSVLSGLRPMHGKGSLPIVESDILDSSCA